MLLLRFLAILAALGMGASVVTWVFTGERRYLGYAWNIGRATLAVALLIMVLLAAERIIVL